MSQINSITSISWVPQGVAKQIPDKVELSKDLLKKLIAETTEELQEYEDDIKESEYDGLELEALEDDLKIGSKKINERKNSKNDSKEKINNKIEMEIEDDVEKICNFDTYDEEPEGVESLLKLGKLTMYASAEDDPYIIEKDDDDDQSEKCDNEILESDNLITLGHVDGDASILEVYVYNKDHENLYVHHDINLSSVPFCMEWLNFDEDEEKQIQGNMVAVGSLSPVIEVWDLDIIDCQEPVFTLGRKAKKKKKISALGHKDAVLCLGWNKELQHILASGSCDKTVILWDLHTKQEAQKISCFQDHVQDLKWHFEGKQLLTGSCDKILRLTDCVSNETKQWKLDGEIESISWGNCKQNNLIYASTDKGTLFCCDPRNTKPLWKVSAHQKACTCISFSSTCAGCLITVSEDETVKIWDVLNDKPELIETRNPKLGVIYTVSSCPDAPFVIGMGGDNKLNNFKVWDTRHSINVRRRFCERVGLPVDEDKEEDEGDDFNEVVEDEVMDIEEELLGAVNVAVGKKQNSSKSKGWKPPPKKKKKKGGHLDKKKAL